MSIRPIYSVHCDADCNNWISEMPSRSLAWKDAVKEGWIRKRAFNASKFEDKKYFHLCPKHNKVEIMISEDGQYYEFSGDKYILSK